MPYVGLVNNGNSCFINAIIQMLYRVPEAKSVDTEPLKAFFAKMAAAEAAPIAKAVDLELGTNPGDFECPVTQISSSAKDEAARKRDNNFIEKEKKEISVKKSNPREHQDAADFLLKSILNKNEKLTPFNFELKTQSFCIDNEKKVKHHEEAVKTPEKILALELKLENNSVQENINSSLNDEDLPDTYAECKKYAGTKGVKKTSIQSSQDYLIVQLKRYGNDLKKIKRPITINPTITLSGKQWAVQGAVLHTGDLNGGHYRYLWKGGPETWILFDDATVSNPATADVKKELNTNGYILLYKKTKNVIWRNNTVDNTGIRRNITIPATLTRSNVTTRTRKRSRNNANPPNAKLLTVKASPEKPPPANNRVRRTQKKKYGFKSFIKSLLTPKNKKVYESPLYKDDSLIKELVYNHLNKKQR